METQTVQVNAIRPRMHLRYLLFAIAIALGVVQAWFGRSAMHGIDGISYLDLGDAYFRGDWSTAANGVWSPLYALLVAGVLRILKPSIAWEFPLVHIVNFAIYLTALFSFDFLWNEFGAVLRQRSDDGQSSWAVFPEWAWLLLGYSLFLWVSLQLITVVAEGPDMLLAVAIYLASALLLRISRNRAQIGDFLILGAILGLGYLTKAIFFPLSFVFLGVAAFMTYKGRLSLARPFTAGIIFLLISSPLIVLLSRAKGRLTFGDAGTINYLWHVDRVPRMYWQGDFLGSGAPIHPPRLIFASPAVYEFASPFRATFPPWYDPSYWYEGMHPHFDSRKQLRALIEAAGIYHGLFLKPGAALLAISLTLLLLGGSLKDLVARLDVFLPAAAALVAYALVHVEPRYVAPFLLVFWGGILCQIRLPKTGFSIRLLHLSARVIVAIYALELTAGTITDAAMEKDSSGNMRQEIQVAQDVQEAGLLPGDSVAAVAGTSAMTWAHLAKLRIVADAPDDTDFWFEPSATRARAINALTKTGAKALVVPRPTPPQANDGWKRIGLTSYYIYPLAPSQ